MTDLCRAVRYHRSKKLETMLQNQQINVNEMCEFIHIGVHQKMTPLGLAVNYDDALITSMLLKRPDIDVNEICEFDSSGTGTVRTNIGLTPLGIAIQGQSLNMVSTLLEHPDINVNATCKFTPYARLTPLQMAKEMVKEKNGGHEMVKLLSLRGAHV